MDHIKEAITLLFSYSPAFPGISTWEGVLKTLEERNEHEKKKKSGARGLPLPYQLSLLP